MTTIQEIPLNKIKSDDDFNCRGKITPRSVAELSENIDQHGLMQNLVVVPVDGSDTYLLLCGHRRFEAVKMLGWETVDCKIQAVGLSEHDRRIFNLLENVQREDLTLVQEALAIEPLLLAGDTEGDISKALDKSRGWVQIRRMVCVLPHVLHDAIDAKVITQENVRELYAHHAVHGADESFYQQVRWVKDQKTVGNLKNVSLKDFDDGKEKTSIAKVRNKAEIIVMQQRIQKLFSVACIEAKILGWAAGFITGVALDEALEKEVDDLK